MKYIYFLFLFVMVSMSPIYSQSVYHNTAKNSFFSTTAVTKSGNYLSIGSGVGYSINSRIDLALIYSWQRDQEEIENRFKMHGQGLGAYIELLLLSELEEDLLGAEVGLVYNRTSFTRTDGWSEITSNIFGIGLNLSKRIGTSEIGYVVPQLGFTFFPVAETSSSNNWYFYTEKYSTLTFTAALVKNISSIALVAEPSMVFNLFEQSVSPALSLGLTF